MFKEVATNFFSGSELNTYHYLVTWVELIFRTVVALNPLRAFVRVAFARCYNF